MNTEQEVKFVTQLKSDSLFNNNCYTFGSDNCKSKYV
jgi:hypothetical protein